MQRVNDQAAFILHRRDYQNTSLILDVFTRDFGRVSVMVKSAKKRKDVASFQIGHRLSISWSGHAELKTLLQVESRMISLAVKSFAAVYYINELLIYLLAKGDVYSKIFDAYQLLLVELGQLIETALDYQYHLEVLLRNFEIELMTELGYMPSLDRLSQNGDSVLAEQYYSFEVFDGASLCIAEDSVHQSFNGADLIAIQKRDFTTEKTLRTAKKVMRLIIDYHLQGRTLQSREFYNKLNNHKIKRQ